jgi:aspartate carbamoyltransferase catalytic subunit
MIGNFKGKHILHGNQFSKEDLDMVMQVADEFEKAHEGESIGRPVFRTKHAHAPLV